MTTRNLFSAALCLCASAIPSWGAVMEVGYCRGNASAQTVSKVGNCDVSAAVVLSAETLKPYRNAEISGIRLYLATSDNLTSLSAWVREDLGGENLAEGVGALQEGWQNVYFDNKLVVGDQPIVIGYTFDQTKSSKCIALGGDIVPDGHYFAKRGEWEAIPAPKGSVCVELIVEGDCIPESDIAVESMTLESTVAKIGEPLRLKAKVGNASLSPRDGFSYSVVCPAMNHEILKGSSTETIDPKQAIEIELSVPTDIFPVNESIPLAFVVEDSGYDGNDTAETLCGIYDEAFPRLLLMEEFTTEECPNCPRAINSIASALENGYGDSMVVVAHHVGFYTDWLTLPEESALLWLYGDDGSFAPAGMYDRTIRTPELLTPVESIGYYDTFAPRLDEAIGKPGFVKLNVTAASTDTGIEVRVDAEAHPLLEALLAEPRLTVLLTESGMRHVSQAGISNPEFTHSHASRGYLTGVFGDPVEFDADGKLHWTGSIACDSAWNPDNMEAVAFINAYDPDDRTACSVFNVAASHLSSSAVDAIEAESSAAIEYFDLAGRRVLNPAQGLFIKAEHLPDGSIRTSKITR